MRGADTRGCGGLSDLSPTRWDERGGGGVPELGADLAGCGCLGERGHVVDARQPGGAGVRGMGGRIAGVSQFPLSGSRSRLFSPVGSEKLFAVET